MPTNRDAAGAMDRFPVPVTSSWSIGLPDGYAAIGISRGPPRGRRGYRMYSALAPGAWYRSVDETRFVELYRAQLATLDAKRVLADLAMIADDRIEPSSQSGLVSSRHGCSLAQGGGRSGRA
jgi:hypothetical protein